jgi:hypothetical protein
MSTFGKITGQRVLPGCEVRFTDLRGDTRDGLVIDMRVSPWSRAETYYVKCYGRMVEVPAARMLGVVR